MPARPCAGNATEKYVAAVAPGAILHPIADRSCLIRLTEFPGFNQAWFQGWGLAPGG